MEYSKDQVPFLDTLIKRNENGIWMDLYQKPKDTQRFLPFTSSHSNHGKRNIPFCLARRICAIAENNQPILAKKNYIIYKFQIFKKLTIYHNILNIRCMCV